MDALRPYNLTILLHPQASAKEREAAQETAVTWVTERGGTMRDVTQEEKRRLAYPIAHVHQVNTLTLRFDLPPQDVADLRERLQRQKKVLRFMLLKHLDRDSEKTLKDLPPRGVTPEPAKAPPPKKEKASIEKLDEKIEEILGEEVL